MSILLKDGQEVARCTIQFTADVTHEHVDALLQQNNAPVKTDVVSSYGVFVS
jgi:hypothetical protein